MNFVTKEPINKGWSSDKKALGKSLNSVIEADNIAVCVIAERNITATVFRCITTSNITPLIPTAFALFLKPY